MLNGMFTVLDDLHGEIPPAPDLLYRTDVPRDTWAGLLTDGHYRRLTDGCALRAGAIETAEYRARAIVGPLPVRSVVARTSAAWVHLGGHAPGRLELVVPPGRRVDPSLDWRCTEASLTATDVVELGGHLVTTPARTLFDLAFVPDADELWTTLVGLCDVGADPAVALASVTNQRGSRRARAVLVRLNQAQLNEAQPNEAHTCTAGSEAALAPVMRYTS